MAQFLVYACLSVSTVACILSNDVIMDDGYYPNSEDSFLLMLENESFDEELISENAKNCYNTYWLYTRTNPYNPECFELGNNSSVQDSNFNVTDVTVFLVHGWNGNGWNSMNNLLTRAFLEDNDVNVIVVDWSELANKNYITAKLGVPDVGTALGQFINWLVTLGVSYDTVHLVGFSLGAHVVGNAGRETNSRVRRITGLDPGGPLWKNDKNRLMPSDAQYVEVIHTNTALYGYGDPCGDADFYPNGGYKMPDCILNYCSHRRSYEYMSTTLQNNRFLANECNNLQDILENTCTGTLYPMGNSDLTKSRSGIFRVNT